MQYVPEYTTLTELDDGKGGRTKQRGVEWRNLKAFIIGVGAISVFSWCGFKAVTGLSRLAWYGASSVYSSLAQ